jgi:hypothetical protein
MTFDPDAFQERAAIMEYDAGMTRFQAETQAARAQGVHRWEAIGAIARRAVEAARHNRAVAGQSRADNVPGMQRQPKEENGPVPECEPNAGWHRVELLSLRAQRGDKE